MSFQENGSQIGPAGMGDTTKTIFENFIIVYFSTHYQRTKVSECFFHVLTIYLSVETNIVHYPNTDIE